MNPVSERLRRTISSLGIVVLIVVYGVPLVWIILTSVKSNTAIQANPAGPVFAPTFNAYVTITTQGTLGTAALNSAIIAIFTTLLTMCIAVPTAYGLDRTKGFILSAGLGVLVLLQMIPQTATIIPLYKVFATWRMLGTLTSVVLADTALLLPFTVLVLRPFASAISTEIEEAAEIDGANVFARFFRIVVPLMSNGVATAASLVFILSWGEFLNAISFLTEPQSYPISALISQEISNYGISWSGLMAIAVVGSLPILLVFLVAQNRLASGLSLGAIK